MDKNGINLAYCVRLFCIGIIMVGCSHKDDSASASTDTKTVDVAKGSPSQVASVFIEAYANRDIEGVRKVQCSQGVRNYDFDWIDRTETGIQYQLGDEVVRESNIIINGKRLNSKATVNMIVRRNSDGFQKGVGVFLQKIDGVWKVCGVGESKEIPSE